MESRKHRKRRNWGFHRKELNVGGLPEWADTGEGQREQKQLSAWSYFNNLHPEVGPESIEWFIEGQAFFEVVRFGASPTPSTVSIRSTWRHTERLRKRDNLVRGEGGKGWGGAE